MRRLNRNLYIPTYDRLNIDRDRCADREWVLPLAVIPMVVIYLEDRPGLRDRENRINGGIIVNPTSVKAVVDKHRRR